MNDITPPHGLPVVTTTATVREGRHLAPPTPAELPPPESHLWANLELARALFGEAREPLADASYPRMKPGLHRLYDQLREFVRQKLGDDEALDLLLEVRNYLPRLRDP